MWCVKYWKTAQRHHEMLEVENLLSVKSSFSLESSFYPDNIVLPVYSWWLRPVVIEGVAF